VTGGPTDRHELTFRHWGYEVNGILLASRLVVGLVLLVASLGKLADRQGSRDAVVAFGVPKALSRAVAGLLPLAELAGAVLLFVTSTARIGAAVSLGLFVLFTGGIARSLLRGESPDCHCFGQLHSTPAGPKTLARNAALAGIATLVLVGGSGTSATAWLGRLSGTSLAVVIAGVLVVALGAGAAALTLSLLRRHGELLLRIERLEEALAQTGIVIPQAQPDPVGVPLGSPAPELDIPDLDGEVVSLPTLTAAGKPVVLTFTDPGCGPCSALLPQIANWQREHADNVRIVLVSRGSVDANLAHAREHGVVDVLLQADSEVSQRYRVNGTPAAVLISPDGTIASWVHGGADEITALVISQIPPAPLEVQHVGPAVGDPAPDPTLQTLAGEDSPLSSQITGRTAVLFWNPGCGFCQQMLPDLKRFDEARPDGAPGIVVISTGDPDQNREMGLRAPVLLDGSFAAGRAFGATGTPSAVIVDEEGRVASGIAVGAPAVLELVGAEPSVLT
jgi:methylamine dehydrogenase accessory protein MauD